MNLLFLDLETRSKCKLKVEGAYRYAEHPSTKILLFAYAWNFGPTKVWDLTSGAPMPEDLKKYIAEAEGLVAHNSAFDRNVLKRKAPWFPADRRWYDTMIMAYLHAMPGALKDLSKILELGDDGKKDTGKAGIDLFCVPQKTKGKNGKEYWATAKTHPEEWAEFVEYAKYDIIAMQKIFKKLPRWNAIPQERALWDMDTRMNDRGFLIDIELANKSVELLAEEKQIRDKETQRLTGDEVTAATQRDKMLKFILKQFGVSLPDLKKSTIERRLLDDSIPEPVKELLRIRLMSAATSGSKWKTLLKTVSSDGRLRGTMQFGAAFRTLRWGGRRFQPQNLPRPKFGTDDIKVAIDMVHRDFGAEYLDLMYGSRVDMLSSALRSALIVPPGKRLVVADLSAIEGRVLAYLAGESWKLRAYADYDAGMGHDLYKLAYARAFSISADDVTKAQRQLGKTLELALGYEGGVGAFICFALVYNINLETLAADNKFPEWAVVEANSFWDYCVKNNRTLNQTKEVFVACDTVKRMWRRDNPNIVKFWAGLRDAFIMAVRTGASTQVGRVVIDKKGSWVRMRLPSGRHILYPSARYDPVKRELSYLGLNTYSRKWCRLKTHGGKLAGNSTQGFSRDVFGAGVLDAEADGYDPLLLVHDELAAEAPDRDKYSVDRLMGHLCRERPWTKGLPLAADGFVDYVYHK
jgi:DNA polymerase bacteriophage-type